ncbi:hypothetical protein WJX81_007032 [Elliptochloris bilobata]|uniref:Protein DETOXIFICATION n=1 Tax=Elliptochloris bilobata TaxID=381761 RepID=A0AAW1RQV4_9CHLO
MEAEERYDSYKNIFLVSLPAIALNAAAPLTVTVQTALLGQKESSAPLAAFAAVNTSANLACFLFNFLVDGVAAKVGQSAGARDWQGARHRAKLAIVCALGAGGLAAVALAALQRPISAFLHLEPEVRYEARVYWWLRAGLAPLVLLNMAFSGILQGYARVGASAALNTAQSLAEICTSVVVLAVLPPPAAGRLAALGGASIVTAALAAAAGCACVTAFSPAAPAAHKDAGDLTSPLIADQPGEGHMRAGHAGSTAEAAEGGAPGGNLAAAMEPGHLLDFVRDGASMLVRSAVLQVTFFLAMAVSGRLGTATLAAHQVVAQLWMLTSYIVDGFAVAGTVLGSRLAPAGPAAHLRDPRRFARLARRVLLLGVLVGGASGAALHAWRDAIIVLFTAEPRAVAALRGPVWVVVCVMQPINGAVFVYDGLLYATQSFAWVRDVMVSGFVVAFLPVLAGALWGVHALWAVWAAKAAHNLWRLAGAAIRIHWQQAPRTELLALLESAFNSALAPNSVKVIIGAAEGSASAPVTLLAGTILYMAPEVFSHSRVSRESDVYSFGMMMLELYIGQPLFPGLGHPQVMYMSLKKLRTTVPADMPDDYRALMERCWAH